MDPCSSSQRHTNWSKNCLCQLDKKDELKCPNTNPAKSENDGYTTLARNIPLFHALNALPIKLDPGRLDTGEGIEKTLKDNKAKYHDSCRRLFCNTKLERAQKKSRRGL